MGYKNREIEVKFQIPSEGSRREVWADVLSRLKTAFKGSVKWEIFRVGTDYYWKSPKFAEGDFLRLRQGSRGRGIFTVKSTDRGDNLDRVEIDNTVSFDTMKETLTLGLGPHAAAVTKRYQILFFEKRGTHEPANVSVYQIEGCERIYVEIEARTLAEVRRYCGIFRSAFPESVVVRSSLYDIYVEKKPIQSQKHLPWERAKKRTSRRQNGEGSSK